MVMVCFKYFGIEVIVGLFDGFKEGGFKLLIILGIIIGIDDIVLLFNKGELLVEVDQMFVEIEQNFEFGFMIEEECYKQVVQLWNNIIDVVKDVVFENFLKNYFFNLLWIMSQLGVCGNLQQICQFVGMCGLMVCLDGLIIEVLICVSFCEGLIVLEYFIFIYGVCKGGVDIVLCIVDLGYLICKLVDVVYEVVVCDVDCGSIDFIVMLLGVIDECIGEWCSCKGSEIEISIYGCILIVDVEFSDGCVIFEGEMFLMEDVKVIVKDVKYIGEVFVCMLFNCCVKVGVCQKCYGYDFL